VYFYLTIGEGIMHITMADFTVVEEHGNLPLLIACILSGN
jgi:hypothetical protein